MGLGVVTGSFSIVRIVLNWQNGTDDPTWASVPNSCWRAWEIAAGIAAACIPTLRPGYKWLVNEMNTRFIKLHSGDPKPAPRTKWTPPKPSAFLKSSKNRPRNTLTLNTREDFLPLQSFGPSIRANMEHYPSEDQDQPHYPKDELGNERRVGLHIPGDLSTHRPAHFKRLDSEAKVGGGLGAEEIEHRV